MKKRVLLTGARGFVGGNFLSLYKNDFDIVPFSFENDDLKQIQWNGIHSVLHCAALVHQMKGAPEESYFRINYEKCKKLAESAKAGGVKHFIFISTTHVFGDSGNLYDHQFVLSEKSVCQPHDPYGRSKLKAENYLFSLQDDHFSVTVIRPPMVYGKGAKGNIKTLASLVKKLPLLPLGYKSNKRSLIYVENLCKFIALTLETQATGVLLPQDSHPVSISELVLEISNALNKRLFLFNLPGPILRLVFALFPKLSLRLFGTLALDSVQSNLKIQYVPPYTTREGMKRTFSSDSPLSTQKNQIESSQR